MKKEMTRAQRRRQAKIRKMILSLSMVLVLSMAAVGGTIAWLTAKTGPVINTFTIGDINIEIDETTGEEYKMIPGATIAKDPFVTVLAGSEKCYVFVKVFESENLGDFVSYTVDSSIWTELDTETEPGVYYKLVEADEADQDFSILTGDEVQVLDSVTKEALTADDFVEPTLTFKAYAVQFDNIEDPDVAWGKIADADKAAN